MNPLKHHQQVHHKNIHASKFQQGLHITAIVINQIGSTEGQSQGQDNLSHRMYKRSYPCRNNQDDAGFPAHDGWIMQRLAMATQQSMAMRTRTKISMEPKNAVQRPESGTHCRICFSLQTEHLQLIWEPQKLKSRNQPRTNKIGRSTRGSQVFGQT